MARFLAVLLALFPAVVTAQDVAVGDREAPGAAALSPRTVAYTIDVTFDPELATLALEERLTWRNDTGAPVDTIYLHLYLNAFRNSQSTFMRESGGQLRGDEMAEGGWGFVEIDSITRADDGVAIGDGLEFFAPDDGNTDDRTLARVPLGRLVGPGESISLDLGARAKLPYPFARTGAIDGYAMVGQWFPKVVKWDRGRWNLHQMHANSEFFADFGVYDVAITVPSDHVVGATGVEVDRVDNGDGTTTHHYRAEDVHDFAWTASPDFVEFTGTVQDVAIRALVHRDHVAQGPRHVEAAKKSVAWFQDRIGDYPFPNLTVVDPAPGADGSGGMEYPTLITAGTSYRQRAGNRSLEHVIHHEFGHNFWYHLLASNEFEESWLDEGINTWTDIRAMEEVFGNILDLGPFGLSYLEATRAAVVLGPKTDAILTPSWGYASAASYGLNSYAKPGVVLETLRNHVGAERFDAAIRHYVATWRFRHPRSDDFIAALESSLGQDLDWFFDQAVRSAAVLDYAVARVASEKVDDGGYGLDLEVEDAFVPAPDEAEEGDDASQSDEVEVTDEQWRSTVLLERRGDFAFPVVLEVRFDDGEVLREQWDGQSKWRRFDWVRAAKIEVATVDPERTIPLDVNGTNNSRRREAARLGVDRLSSRAIFLLQNALELLSW